MYAELDSRISVTGYRCSKASAWTPSSVVDVIDKARTLSADAQHDSRWKAPLTIVRSDDTDNAFGREIN